MLYLNTKPVMYAKFGVKYLWVEVTTGLRLRASEQSDAVVVLLTSGPAALSQILPIFQRKQVVSHPTWGRSTGCLMSCQCACLHIEVLQMIALKVLLIEII